MVDKPINFNIDAEFNERMDKSIIWVVSGLTLSIGVGVFSQSIGIGLIIFGVWGAITTAYIHRREMAKVDVSKAEFWDQVDMIDNNIKELNNTVGTQSEYIMTIQESLKKKVDKT